MKIVRALNWRTPPEIARVGFSTQTKLPGGFGGPGGSFLVVVAAVALPLLLLLLEPPPGPPKPPGNLVRVENSTQAISGGGALIKRRDYTDLKTIPGKFSPLKS